MTRSNPHDDAGDSPLEALYAQACTAFNAGQLREADGLKQT